PQNGRADGGRGAGDEEHVAPRLVALPVLLDLLVGRAEGLTRRPVAAVPRFGGRLLQRVGLRAGREREGDPGAEHDRRATARAPLGPEEWAFRDARLAYSRLRCAPPPARQSLAGPPIRRRFARLQDRVERRLRVEVDHVRRRGLAGAGDHLAVGIAGRDVVVDGGAAHGRGGDAPDELAAEARLHLDLLVEVLAGAAVEEDDGPAGVVGGAGGDVD